MNTINVRTSCPKKSDKYSKCYKRKASGGWSDCIKGKPTEEYVDVLRNCVGFATGRFNEIINEVEGVEGMRYQIKCNAENFIEKAKALGLEISQVPSPGAIGVLQKGPTLKSEDGAGHVFMCEYPLDLNPNAYKVFTSESGYESSRAFWNATRSNENGKYGAGAKYKFRGWIVNPAVKKIQPAVVERNTTVNQIKTLKAMNVRLGIETNKETIAYVPIGTVFNYYAKKNGKSSVWYAVNEDKTQWVAGKSLSGDKKYVEELPASQPTPTPTPTPTPSEYKVDDKVVIIGKYASSASAKVATNSAAKGKTRYIVKIYKGRNFPYQLGVKKGNTSSANTTGFANDEGIKKA